MKAPEWLKRFAIGLAAFAFWFGVIVAVWFFSTGEWGRMALGLTGAALGAASLARARRQYAQDEIDDLEEMWRERG